MIVGVLVAGFPGKMATLVADSIRKQKDMVVYQWGFSEDVIEGCGLIPSKMHEEFLNTHRSKIDLAVDFTQPRSVNRNAEMYCRAKLPFVMGTTGGDRNLLYETILACSVPAVVATNMAAPIVAFQSMIHAATLSSPKVFEGYRLVIRESHQAGKPDPSGTAVGLLESFTVLGMPFTKEQIIMVRDPVVQEVEMGIPKEHLGGHGYHTYTLLSPNGDVFM